MGGGGDVKLICIAQLISRNYPVRNVSHSLFWVLIKSPTEFRSNFWFEAAVDSSKVSKDWAPVQLNQFQQCFQARASAEGLGYTMDVRGDNICPLVTIPSLLGGGGEHFKTGLSVLLPPPASAWYDLILHNYNVMPLVMDGNEDWIIHILMAMEARSLYMTW